MNNDNQHIPSGYKPSPLGIIPEDWEMKRLEEVCINDGDYGLNAPATDYDKNLPTYLRITDIDDDGNFNQSDKKSVNSPLSENYFLKDGDIVFARTGATVGKTYLYDKNDGELVYAGFLIKFTPDKERILPYYLKSQTNTKEYANWVSITSQRSGQPGINAAEYCSYKFVLPPLAEQKRICDLLSLWDTAIAKQTALIEQLTLRKRGLMQQLLTGKKRLKGFEGGTFHRLGNYITECNRRNNGCNRVLSVTNTRGFILQEEQFDKIVASNDTSNYKIVRRGEFAYNPSRVNVGSLAMLNEYHEGILSPMYIVFKANENIDKSYLLQSLQSWWFRGHIPAYTQGSVRDSLSFDGLCSMKFYIPTLQEQKAISAILERADKEIGLQKQKLTALQEQKKGLMQVLLTGKRRI